jgi:hypothetical protein
MQSFRTTEGESGRRQKRGTKAEAGGTNRSPDEAKRNPGHFVSPARNLRENSRIPLRFMRATFATLAQTAARAFRDTQINLGPAITMPREVVKTATIAVHSVIGAHTTNSRQEAQAAKTRRVPV